EELSLRRPYAPPNARRLLCRESDLRDERAGADGRDDPLDDSPDRDAASLPARRWPSVAGDSAPAGRRILGLLSWLHHGADGRLPDTRLLPEARRLPRRQSERRRPACRALL